MHQAKKSKFVGTEPKLQGSIIQLWLAEYWKQDDWAEELGYMANVGMDHLILQWTVDKTPERIARRKPHAFYPTEIEGIEPRLEGENTWRCIDFPLHEAKKREMTIWLGLVWNKAWEENFANNAGWLNDQFDLAANVLGELWTRITEIECEDIVAGFYMPLEMDNVHFRTLDEHEPDDTPQDRMAGHYRNLAGAVHQLGKKLMVAPFFNEKYSGDHQLPKDYAKMWEYILSKAPIDVIALQDGIGTGVAPDDRHCSIETIANWLDPLSKVVADADHPTELWADVELYDEVRKDVFYPAHLDRIRGDWKGNPGQLQAEAEFVSKMTSYSFNHHMSPKNYFGKYKKFVDEL